MGEAGTPLAAALGDAGDADIVESLFLASTAEVLDGLVAGVVRLAVAAEVPVAAVALDVVLGIAGLAAGFGLDVLVGAAAFRAAVADERVGPRFSANVSDLAGDCVVEDARDVLRAAAASGFLVSSPDPPTDGRDRWAEGAEVAEEAGVAVLLAGFRTAKPPAGRVGGLLRPPVVLAAWVAEDVDEVAGRLAAVVVGRFAEAFSCFVPFAAAFGIGPFPDSVSASGAISVASSPDRMSPADSAGGAWEASPSAMAQIIQTIKF